MNDPEQVPLLQMLLSRLERVPADSYWAHRASGIRGSLLAALDKFETGKQVSWQRVKQLIELGFQILGKAAKEK